MFIDLHCLKDSKIVLLLKQFWKIKKGFYYILVILHTDYLIILHSLHKLKNNRILMPANLLNLNSNKCWPYRYVTTEDQFINVEKLPRFSL